MAPAFTFSRGLGVTVYDAAGTAKPGARSVLVVTNASVPAVENSITRKLAERWQINGFQRLDMYEFDAKYQLIHDVIDPLQQHQHTTLVYPILLDLITREK